MYFINLGKTNQRLEAMIRGEHICHFLIKSLRVESKLTSYFCAIPIQWATLQFLTNFTKTPGWLPWNLFRHALDCSAIQFFQTRLEEYLPREGADQCTAGIQLKWIGDSQTIKYFAVLYMLKLLNPNQSNWRPALQGLILPPRASVLGFTSIFWCMSSTRDL